MNSGHLLEAKSLRGFFSYLARAASLRSTFPPGRIEGGKRSESFITTKSSLFYAVCFFFAVESGLLLIRSR